MPAPSYTYTHTNGTTADASQVMQNFNDILNGVTDGTKDLSISALTCAGTATFNGSVAVGNASADDFTVTASLASTIPVKTDSSFDIGSTSLRLRRIYADAMYGVVDGVAASAGDVGEILETNSFADFQQATPTVDTYYDVTSASVTLTAGCWLLEAAGDLEVIFSTGDATARMALVIRDSSNNLIAESWLCQPYKATSDGCFGTVRAADYVNISSSTTYKISIKWHTAFGSPTVSFIGLRKDTNANNAYSRDNYIRGIRIR
jgi:hypothetical protein